IPGQTTKTVRDNPVQLVDLMPTILDLVGVAIPKEVQGVSFEPLLQGQSITPRFAYSESMSGSQNFGTAPLRSIQDSTYKYIDTAHPELYNIRSDQEESSNLYDQKRDLALKMKAEINKIVSRNSADAKTVAEERKLTPEQEEQFASLGYIGESGGSPTVDVNRDAKDYILYWNYLIEANSDLKDGKNEDALAILQKMRDADALPVSAKIFEARAYAGLHQYDRAISSLEEILKKDPLNSQA